MYLKECLDQVAILVKKGPYALKYTLKTEFKKLKEAERAARLGELAQDDDNEEDIQGEEGEEDEIEMEDVL